MVDSRSTGAWVIEFSVSQVCLSVSVNVCGMTFK